MPRRARKARPKPSPRTFPSWTPTDDGANPAPTAVAEEVDPASKAWMDKVLDSVRDGEWGVFVTRGPQSAQAQKPDCQWRTQPLTGTEEFIFEGLHIGKRGKVLFRFKPIDPTYIFYEFPEDKVFDAIKPGREGTPSFESRVCMAIAEGGDEELRDAAGESFGKAITAFKAQFYRARNEEKKTAAQKQAREDQERQQTNPLWGSY